MTLPILKNSRALSKLVPLSSFTLEKNMYDVALQLQSISYDLLNFLPPIHSNANAHTPIPSLDDSESKLFLVPELNLRVPAQEFLLNELTDTGLPYQSLKQLSSIIYRQALQLADQYSSCFRESCHEMTLSTALKDKYEKEQECTLLREISCHMYDTTVSSWRKELLYLVHARLHNRFPPESHSLQSSQEVLKRVCLPICRIEYL